MTKTTCAIFACLFVLASITVCPFAVGAPAGHTSPPFPRSLDSYNDHGATDLFSILKNRVKQEPFNLVASMIFLCAIIHTFMTSHFLAVAHQWEVAHLEKVKQGLAPKSSVHIGAKLFHFFGAVEVVFGLWVVALIQAIIIFYDRPTMINYISYHVDFTEAMFVVTVMTLAASRPILKLAEAIMRSIADLFGGSLAAWWLTILTIGPILGSLISEPAAMTLSALLLASKLYNLNPSENFKYATIGLLFVNISVGGTLTHFAAPPVLMVAGPWDWNLFHMLINFGWKAVLGIAISNGLYFFVFRDDLKALEAEHAVRRLKEIIQRTFMPRTEMMVELEKIAPLFAQDMKLKENFNRQTEELIAKIKNRLKKQYLSELIRNGNDPDLVNAAFDQRFEEVKLLKLQETLPALLSPEKRAPFIDPNWDNRDDPVPAWVTAIHVIFMGWIIFNAHHPELFVPGLLFFLGFTVATSPYQNRIELVQPMLVGFFLGALVVHGGVQGWWIAPVLGSLKEVPLMFVSTILTAFNDNAAITLLSTLVPDFADELKYSVLSGAVAGGGLTVIANAPNPAGQSILNNYFKTGISAIGLLKASVPPTIIVWLCFFVFR
jgi:hypothetical protein